MTITTRLRILEQRILPAEPAPIDTGATWLEAAPPAVLDYYVAVAADVERTGQVDPDDANDRAHAAHPLLKGVAVAVELEALRGAPVDLRRVQWELLADASCRLGFAVAAERGKLHDTETDRQCRQRLYGFPGDWSSEGARRVREAYGDRTGAAWAALWRECGTSDPDVLALAGLHAAELALLAADE
jgi:hypothetical protein